MATEVKERFLRYNAAKYVDLAHASAFPRNIVMWMDLARQSRAKADALEFARTGIDPLAAREQPRVEPEGAPESNEVRQPTDFDELFAQNRAAFEVTWRQHVNSVET